ncbi:MAG: rod shape-determining protein MreC [Patescibacteria group bacterium]
MKFSKKYFLIIIILLIVVVVMNIIPGLINSLGNFVFKIFSPVQNFFIRAGDRVIGFFEVILSIKDLSKENAELQKENLELDSIVTQLKEIERENRILREGLDISQRNQLNLEFALIVGKDIQGSQDWVLINKGSDDGLKKDMAVISKEFALVGKTIEVMPDFSKIILITNKESIVAALIEGERSQGLVKREEKGKLFMDFIPRNEKLEIGAKVITSGMDKIYPKGILIGKIESIDLSQNQLFQKVTILPAVDFSKLEEVFIVK